MTAPDEPQTDAGRQAAADKAAAAERIREQAAADQAAAAAAEARRQQTAAARAAKAAGRPKSAEPAAAPEPVAVDEQPAQAQGCEECRQSQEIIFERLGRLEVQVQAIGKLIATGIVAGAVIWYLSRRSAAAPVAELAAAEPAE